MLPIARFQRTLPLVLAVSLVLAGCAAPRPTTTGGGPNAGPAAQTVAVRVATVQSGPVATTLDFTGDVRPKRTVVIAPKQIGRIADIPVEVGDVVTKGELLAELDHASLEAQVEQAEAVATGPKPGVVDAAQAQARAAEEKVATLRDGGRSEQVSSAESQVAAARARLNSMLVGGRPEQVAQAQSQLDTARAKLNTMLNGGRPEQIAQAEATLNTARAKLRQIENGPRLEDVTIAKSNLDAAQAKLDQLLAGPTPEQIQIAETQVRIAKNNLNATLSNADLQASRGIIGEGQKEAQAGVGFEQVRLAEEQLANLLAGPTPEQVAQAREAVRQAEAMYQKAASPYSTSDRIAAEAAVRQAEEQLELARNLYTANDIAQAEAAVRAAEAQVALAATPYTEHDIARAQAQVQQAEAQAALAARPATQRDINQAAASADAAQAQVTQAMNAVTAEDVAAARASVDQAEAGVELVRVALEDATIKSPIDGIISEVNGTVGSLTSPQSPLLTIVSPEMEVVLTVDESQLPLLEVGQVATIRVSAFPNGVFTGKIRSLSPTVDPLTRTGTAKIAVEDGGPGRLVAGMFAEVQVTTAERSGVLMVPRTAILERDGGQYVFVIENGVASRRSVRTSPATNNHVEVHEGLTGGEQVALNPIVLHDGDSVTIFQE